VSPIFEYFKPILIDRDPFDITQVARALADDSIWWARSGAGRSARTSTGIANCARGHAFLAGGESLAGLDQFHPLISGGCLHLVQPDLGYVGGIQETVRIVHHAEAFTLGSALHTGAAMGPAFAASWHFAAAFGSVQWLERVVAASSVQDDLLADRFEVRDGTVGLPSSPGLGARVTVEHLEKYRFVLGSGERT
jgi:L-alanine-DL-glutamate epimerase-like enolase superfamily enzyme